MIIYKIISMVCQYSKCASRSRWCSDVFFQGAQSYLGLRSSPADLCELARPLPSADHPVVLFAGEATAVGLHSTFQGAVASGLREADRIIAACKLRWPLVQKVDLPSYLKNVGILISRWYSSDILVYYINSSNTSV